ncbi:MAG: response regulator [Kofleriaceae bacterium]|nr:response regulator [Kofleriaceae bacterium]
MTTRLPTNSDPKRRVLVIDDEPVIHELVADIMDDYEIISAETGAAAKLIVTSGRAYDVALVDKNLSDVSGLELVPWLRQACPDCEVVIITAYPSMDSALEAMSLGATDYLIKPMRDINELRLRVGNACERVRQRRAERKLVEALEQSELSYRELYEASPDAVLVIDAVTRVLHDANSAAERLYGRPRAQLVGMNAADLTSPTAPPIVANGLVRRREKRADGTLVSVEVTTSTLHRDDRVYVVEVIRDVSERERADAERAELEKRLARSTRFEELGRLAAGVAHDVNNLLTVVRTNAELAAEAIGADHIAIEDLDQIQAAVTSAADLTRRLLAFSGRQLVRPTVLDVNTLVANVGKMLTRTFEARARLVVDTCPMPAMTKIDASQLEQVITNLAVNARDAMPEGGTITIRTRVRADEPRVVLEVSDTGVGIPADILVDIFEPFFTTKGSGGTGLGLATVREIVTRSGGTIDVSSIPGRGTTFEIRLPWTDDALAEASGRARTPVHAGRGEAVLVVEDDGAVCEATRRLLGGAGYAVHGVRTAEDALATLATGSAQLVITDIDLPGMSGIDLASQISSLPVVLTSGRAADAKRLEDRPFLPKPYSADDLLRCVRDALDGARR